MANMTLGTDGRYYYETSVSGNFNMHLEKDFDCPVQVLVKTAGSNYAPAYVFQRPAKIIDSDFTAEVYGKSIKVVCLEKAPSGSAVPTIVITEA